MDIFRGDECRHNFLYPFFSKDSGNPVCIYPPGNWEKENHLQKCLGMGYVSSQEDILYSKHLTPLSFYTIFTCFSFPKKLTSQGKPPPKKKSAHTMHLVSVPVFGWASWWRMDGDRRGSNPCPHPNKPMEKWRLESLKRWVNMGEMTPKNEGKRGKNPWSPAFCGSDFRFFHPKSSAEKKKIKNKIYIYIYIRPHHLEDDDVFFCFGGVSETFFFAGTCPKKNEKWPSRMKFLPQNLRIFCWDHEIERSVAGSLASQAKSEKMWEFNGWNTKVKSVKYR